MGGAPVASQTAAVSQGIVPPEGGGGSAAPHGPEKPREAQKKARKIATTGALKIRFSKS